MNKLGATWAIWRGRPVIWRTEIRYGEVDCYGRLPGYLGGNGLIANCRVVMHPGMPPAKANRYEGNEVHA